MLQRVNPLWRVAVVVGVMLVLGLAGTAVAEEEELKWDETFDGHEMWMTDLPAAIKLAAQEGKPLLIDIYSRL
ncbi:MAG TPA: hypothetical protein VM118_13010 [Acidobacteriota bacterium]|nr:hypothetical protein [Acidobacteriota bacterium]